LIEKDNIIINANSGVSGAGRSAKEANLYTEIAEGIHAYGITRHRHVPEIEQGLTDAVGSEVTVSFTPNLMPMVLSSSLRLNFPLTDPWVFLIIHKICF
jgi:N-acetyl-gamma-glutamyl-phosphate reductase